MRAKAAVLLSRTFVFAPKVFLEQPVIIVPPGFAIFIWGPSFLRTGLTPLIICMRRLLRAGTAPLADCQTKYEPPRPYGHNICQFYLCAKQPVRAGDRAYLRLLRCPPGRYAAGCFTPSALATQPAYFANNMYAPDIISGSEAAGCYATGKVGHRPH
jgi:hypothetical protein